ncbi:MAG TPA: polyphenol oxidase family protein [Thermoanaerobaculia bacterium]|nr:polyphenol oxidase family protein [Thermoanaerobaculia bacterium]
MWKTEPSTLGRIVVPPDVPDEFALLCTTRDYPGKIISDELTALVRERFGIETSLTTCTQIHSATVTRAHREGSWRECDSCDALYSSDRNVSLGIKIADCLPISLIDAEHFVIANIHSGWRGAVQNITANALAAAPLDPSSTHAFLGPSIRVCCFEVGEEVASQFDARFIDRTHAKPHVDLIAFTIDVLRSHGITRISDSELCTRCEGSIFHSYRRDAGKHGRNLQVVGQ